MSNIPPRSANAVFRLRINGEMFTLTFSSVQDAERFGRPDAELGKRVEIVDGVTGAVVKRLTRDAPK